MNRPRTRAAIAMSVGSDVMRTYIVNVLWKRPWLTFFLMGVSFLLFGVMTVNIFVLLKANLDLYVNYGTMVIADGALLQLAELVGYGYLSMLFYVLFKACEHVLVRHLTCERQGSRLELRDITERSQQSL